jgi:RNA polymerase sigma factor (sigma-70 family)
MDILGLRQDNERTAVEAAGQGDSEALAGLYERYYAVMVWVAYSVLLDRGLAEDAAQQAFARACEKLARLRDPGRFGPWLTTICRNTARDILRDRQRRSVLHREVARAVPAGQNHNGFDRAVKDAVDRLPAMYREVVVLHYYSGMSYRQIESVLDISGDVVKGRLARARRQLQAHLEKEGFRRER